MGKTKKQRLIPLIILFICLVIYGADQMFGTQTVAEDIQAKQVVTASTPIQTTLKPVATTVTIPVKSNMPTALSLTPSPFALPLTVSNGMVTGLHEKSQNPVINPSIANLPIFSSGSGGTSINFNNTVTPGIPGRDVVLKAILYRPGGINMAILDDGTHEVIAEEGKSTEWGYISEITQNAVTLDDVVLTLTMSDPNQGIRKNRPSNRAEPIFKSPAILNH